MKILCLLWLPLVLFFQQSPSIIKHTPANADTVLIALKKKRAAIDQYVYKHQKDLIVMVKVSGKKNLVRVKNENWPAETEYIYNILKDTTGRVILIAEMPYSESGDWYIEYKNYFDNNGRTFVFSKRETVFDDSVKGGVAMEELFNYYDAGFKIINQKHSLTDKDEKPIKRNNNEFDFRDYKYNIYKNLNACLAGYHIQLANQKRPL
jgi:hypothetical protein